MQPVTLSVYVKVAFPSEIPVMMPLLLIEATAGLLLCHVPPVAGVIAVVLPIQIEPGPFKDKTFLAITLIGTSVIELHPVARL